MPMPFILFATGFLQAVILCPILLCSGSVHTLFPLPFCIVFPSASVLSILHTYFVHIPYSSEFLFDMHIYPVSCCLKGQYRVCLLRFEERKVLLIPRKQEECLENSLLHQCLSSLDLT